MSLKSKHQLPWLRRGPPGRWALRRRTLGPGLLGRVDRGVLEVGGDVLEVRGGCGAVQRLVVLQQRQVVRVRLEVRLQPLRVE